MINRKIPWTSQPQYPVDIDWSNPITYGLVIAFHPGGGYVNLVDKIPLTKVGVSTTVQSELSYSGSSARIYAISPLPIKTIFSRGNHATSIQRWGGAFSNTTNNGLYFDVVSSNFTLVRYSGVWDNASLGIGVTSGVHSLAFASDSAASHRSYYDGVLKTTGTQIVSDPTKLLLGGFMYCQGASFFDGVCTGDTLYLAFSVPKSAAEIKSLSDNPWQIFKSQSRRIWVVGASPVIPTLSAATVINITSTTATPQCVLTF